MFLDEVHEAFHSFDFGDVEFDGRLANVEVDLAGRAAHVAEIRVRHFARAVHDAAHNGDLHALEMFRARLDARRHGLQVEQRPSARRARHVIGLERTTARCLQNVISQPQRLPAAGFATNENCVANAVRQQRTDDDRCPQQGNLRLKNFVAVPHGGISRRTSLRG